MPLGANQATHPPVRPSVARASPKGDAPSFVLQGKRGKQKISAARFVTLKLCIEVKQERPKYVPG